VDTILGIPPGESYSGIRALADLPTNKKKINPHLTRLTGIDRRERR
jgi:hypothetical protein